MPNWTTSPNEHLPRHAEAWVGTALWETRIAALVGLRQSGKTTLARQAFHSAQARNLSLPGSYGLSGTTKAGRRSPRISMSSAVPGAARAGLTMPNAKDFSSR